MAVTKTIRLDGFDVQAYVMLGTVALDYLRETTTVDYVRFPDRAARDRYAAARATRIAREGDLQVATAALAAADETARSQQRATAEYAAALVAHERAYQAFQAADAAERDSFGAYHHSATFDGLIADRAQLYQLSKAAGQVLDGGSDA
mgnify:CR=1 FL=1